MPCPAREEFQIGWICALPIEAAAAKEMLDEDFGMLEEQDAADSNSYRMGRIGKHPVVGVSPACPVDNMEPAQLQLSQTTWSVHSQNRYELV
jgi:hypothetical protein